MSGAWNAVRGKPRDLKRGGVDSGGGAGSDLFGRSSRWALPAFWLDLECSGSRSVNRSTIAEV
jgi:hypothetical protein